MTIDLSKFKGGYAIKDAEISQQLADYAKNKIDWDAAFPADGKHSIQQEYKETFKSWIQSTKLNTVEGLDLFRYSSITNGTSEAFQMFMLRHNHRKFKFFVGDFMMHKVASNVMRADWGWINTPGDITYGDAVIISLPFSDTGEEHTYLREALDQAKKCHVPVLVDMAYFGMCHDIHINLSHKAIEEVTFSLGKTFPLIGARAGIRFQKEEIDDPVVFANQNGIVNNIACMLGDYAMKSWSPDFIPKKYRQCYSEVCHHYNFNETRCLVFATTSDPQYSALNRGNVRTRLCVSKLLEERYNA